jgi:hypothetical protein
MESTGSTYKSVSLAINDELVDEINSGHNTNYSLAELENAADKCLAHEWLTHATLGGGKYSSLRITPKGVGAARSKRKSDELKASRSWLKKMSDIRAFNLFRSYFSTCHIYLKTFGGNIMEDKSFTIELKCLFCDCILKGATKIEYFSGDMLKCQECCELNDCDALIGFASDEGKKLVTECAKNGIEKMFKNAFR